MDYQYDARTGGDYCCVGPNGTKKKKKNAGACYDV
jgi:hypothetical protein